MVQVNSIYQIGNEVYRINAVGQEAATKALNMASAGERVILLKFEFNGNWVSANIDRQYYY